LEKLRGDPILPYRYSVVHGLRQKREGHAPLSNSKKEMRLTDLSHGDLARALAISRK
jgi:hypothetical protein